MDKKLVYFLCTGNSCRSQMAEGFGKKYLDDRWEVKSAGIEAHGLNSNAVKAMREAGIDISSQSSDTIDMETLDRAALVVTLCGDAADKCPAVGPHVRKEHWGFPDPAKAIGTEEEKWEVFRSVRNSIENRIKEFAKEQH